MRGSGGRNRESSLVPYNYCMVTEQQINGLSDDIVRKFHPDKVILFGSYAYGKPTEDSDVDLLVVLPYQGRSVSKAIEIRLAIHAAFALDLLAYPESYIRRRIDMEDFFLREIVTKGTTLYEANHAGVGG